MTKKKRLRKAERAAEKAASFTKQRRQDLRAAHDYRAQQQQRERIPVQRGKTLADSIDEAFEHLRLFFPKLTKAELISQLPPLTEKLDTNWDEPLGHTVMLDLKEKIERACDALGYDIRRGVSIGVLYGKGVEASQQQVMMTDTSVIMMTDHLLLLINRLAKQLALTIPFEIEGERFRICDDIDKVIASANENMELRSNWTKMFIDYAENPGMPDAGEAVIVTGSQRQTMWSDLSEAMKLFVVGHEYAHHILKHSLGDTASVLGEAAGISHRAELDADILGLALSMNAGHDIDPPNTFAVYGIGAVAILSVMEYCRRGENLLKTGILSTENTRDTHPALADRLTCLVKMVPEIMKPYGPDQTSIVNRMHHLFARIIQIAWEPASEALLKAHREGVRPISSAYSGWLP